MNFFTQLTPLFGAIVSFGVFVAGLGYAYGQFFGGKKKQASDQTLANTVLIEGLQSQITGFEKLVERLRTEHKAEVDKLRAENTKMASDIGELNGRLREKESKLAEYKEIFQGKDPNNEIFMKFMTDSATSNTRCMEAITKSLVSLEEWTKSLDERLEGIIK